RYLKVINAVAGGCMDAAGTAVKSNMVAYNYERGSVHEWMLCLAVLKLLSGKRTDSLILRNTRGSHGGLYQLLSHNIVLTVSLNYGILIVRSQAYRKVAWKGPCGSSPDHKISILKAKTQRCNNAIVLYYPKLYIY